MQRIYMVRHGQSKNNAAKIVTGSNESSLSELGKIQAQTAGQHARGLGIDLMATSPMSRARQTSQIIADAIGYNPKDIIEIEEFAERNLGKLEGYSYAHNERLNGNFPAVEHIAGVESLAHFHQRVQHGFRHILRYKNKNILIVCHIGVGRMLKTIVEGKEPFAVYSEPHLDNAKIYPLL